MAKTLQINVKKTAGNVVKKATSTAKNTGKYVSKNPKTVLYVVVGAVGIYAAYKIFKSINNQFNPVIDDNISGTGGPTSNATISNQQATNFAQQLLDAMNLNRNTYVIGGTDEEAIEAVFDQLNNGDDFNLVFNKFGKKDYNGNNSPVEGWEFLDAFELRDLVYWLRSELSSFFDGELYNKVKQRVESAGFSFA